MNPSISIGLVLCILWLLGHAGFTFWSGGFQPGTLIANIFVIVDSLVSIALALYIYNLRDKKSSADN